MRTTHPVEAADVRLLRGLAELDYDLVRAYETAISKLDDDVVRNGLREIVDDHRRHLYDLNDEILDLGGNAWVEEDFRHVLAQGKIFLASLVDDRRIVKALLHDEDEVSQAYARATTSLILAPRIRRMLDDHLDDDRKHRAWLDRTMHVLDAD